MAKVKSQRTPVGGVMRPHRYRAGVVVLRQIRQLQRTTELLIPKVPFHRLVQEVTREVSEVRYRFKADGYEALQEAAENYIVDLMKQAFENAIHAKRVTIMPEDLQLAKKNDDRKAAAAVRK
jgi:histone H3